MPARSSRWGSLVTLNGETINDLLALFARHLKPNGVMIFTAHGDHVLNRMITEHAVYDLRPEDLPAITDNYRRTGYGYHDYPRGQGYFDFHRKARATEFLLLRRNGYVNKFRTSEVCRRFTSRRTDGRSIRTCSHFKK